MTEDITLDELKSRAAVCIFLAHIYKQEITPEFVGHLQSGGLFTLFQEQGYDISQQDLIDPEKIHELAIEFSKVFIGPGPHISPYGSVHHPDDNKKGRLWGDTTVWVRRFILDHGMKFEGKSYYGIPDHISYELEFFALLINSEVEARQSGDDKKTQHLLNSQQMFFEKQLSRWIPDFCDRVMEKTELPFYRAIARLTKEFLELEGERLGSC